MSFDLDQQIAASHFLQCKFRLKLTTNLFKEEMLMGLRASSILSRSSRNFISNPSIVIHKLTTIPEGIYICISRIDRDDKTIMESEAL